MKTNPFYLTSRIPSQFFCDRETETNQLLKIIDNQENVVLMAQRHIGKTGLINHCFELENVRDNFYTISIDILHTSSLKEFVKELENATFATIAKKSEKLRRTFFTTLKSLRASVGYDPVTSTPTFDIRLGDVESPDFSLDEIFAFLEAADRPCIIAIDEFQRIANYPEKNVEELLREKI
ncbi:MAG: ATP-binding protein [Alistipes sp.]|nr:ATP-binding protein [Candidatus Alistipes equi]